MARTLTRKDLNAKRRALRISLDDLCVELGVTGNASEMSRWLREKRDSPVGGRDEAAVDAALTRLAGRVAA